MSDIDEVLGNCLGVRVRLIARSVSSLYDDILQAEGLTISQLSLLVGLGKAGACSPTCLADLVQLERSTVSRNLDRLYEAELVRVVSSDGKGVRNIELTPLGHAKILAVMPKWRLAQERAAKLLGPEGVTTVMKVGSELWPAPPPS